MGCRKLHIHAKVESPLRVAYRAGQEVENRSLNYYPFGMTMTGDWGENTSLNNEKYQYNGIEYLNDHGLNINMARYRMLDPSIGRWLGVDPAAGATMGMSPFNSMGNSPLMYSDPEGDIPLLALAVASAFVQGSFAHEGGGNFFRGAAIGFGSTLASGGIGGLFGKVGSLGHEIGRAGAHGLVGGLGSSLSGGSFGAGFASSALGSGMGSALHGASPLVQLVGSGLAGLGGSVIAGGNPWVGLGQGLALGALNHLSHTGDPIVDGGTLPTVTVTAPSSAPKISYVTGAGAIVGSALTATGHAKYGGGVWRGNNGKYYSTNWGGNQWTGGRSVAKFSSTALRATGTAFGAVNYLGIGVQYANGYIGGGRFIAELGSNTATTFGGLAGVAWGIGWESGRVLTSTRTYQNWKQNSWLPYRRRIWGY